MANFGETIFSFLFMTLSLLALAAVFPIAAYIVRKMNEFLRDK